MICVLIMSISGCQVTPLPPVTDLPATPDLSAPRPEEVGDLSFLPAKALFPRALEIAAAWQTDARLMSVSGTISYQESLSGLNASYLFTSETDASHNLLVFLKTNEPPEQVFVDKPTPAFKQYPVAVEDWLIDIGPALKSSLEQGGTDFLKTHPGVTLGYHLDRVNPEHRLVWRVVYSQLSEPAGKEFRIDAKTGQLLEIR